jgi:hypothetical protein
MTVEKILSDPHLSLFREIFHNGDRRLDGKENVETPFVQEPGRSFGPRNAKVLGITAVIRVQYPMLVNPQQLGTSVGGVPSVGSAGS